MIYGCLNKPPVFAQRLSSQTGHERRGSWNPYINCLKLVKRDGYGCMKLGILRQRVLHTVEGTSRNLRKNLCHVIKSSAPLLNQDAGGTLHRPSCGHRSWGAVPSGAGDARRFQRTVPIRDRWHSRPGHRSDDVDCRRSEKNRSTPRRRWSPSLAPTHTRGT